MKKIEFIGKDLKKVKLSDSDLQEVESLTIWRCTGVDYNILQKTQNLKVLELTNYPYETLADIKQNIGIEKIKIVGIPKLNDITTIKDFKKITSVSIETSPSWDSQKKFAKIKDIKALYDLPYLREVLIVGFDIADFNSDDFLERCSAKNIRIGGKQKLIIKR